MLAQGSDWPCLLTFLARLVPNAPMDATLSRCLRPQMVRDPGESHLSRPILRNSVRSKHLLPCNSYILLGVLQLSPNQCKLYVLHGADANEKLESCWDNLELL